MQYESGMTTITVHVGRDSELGDNSFDFETEITLNDVLRVEGCDSAIYHTFKVKNLPLATPLIEFHKSIANDLIPECS